jgi:hypothetical protein
VILFLAARPPGYDPVFGGDAAGLRFDFATAPIDAK